MKKCTLFIVLISLICLASTIVYKYTHIDLVDAVKLNDSKLIEEKLKIYNDSFIMKDAIILAAYLGYSEPLEILLKYNESSPYYVNLCSLQYDCDLPYYCKNKECVDILLKYGMVLETPDAVAMNPVSNAVKAGNYDMAVYLIKKGLRTNGEILNNVHSNSPELGRMFEELLDSSFWPDYADSAMIYASAHGDIDLIDKTVKKAGNSYLNNGLISIYKYSSLNEYKKVFNRKSLEYLFKKGAEPKSKKALRLLNDAVDAGNYDIVKFLIDKGVPVDKNILGSHYTGNRKIAELLIKKGADVNPAWTEGDSFELPLIRAISMLDPDMVDFWIKNGAKTDTEEYPHEVFIEKCRETSSRNYEWFDFINKDKCKRIEEIIRNALEITSYSQGQNLDDLTGFWTMRIVCFS